MSIFSKLMPVLAAGSLAAQPVGPVLAQAGCTTDAMLVFDGSGSMAEMGFNALGSPRIFDAREAVRRSMPHVAPLRRLGLIVYGPGRGEACSNIALHFPPRPDAAGAIIATVEGLAPEGTTPLTEAVARAAEVLEFRTRAGVVVLVTDGKETCGGTPCRLASDLAAEAAGLTVHVIGFRVRPDYFDWESGEGAGHRETVAVAECLAEKTGGLYVSAETVDDLTAALQVTLGCAVIGMRPGLPAAG
ncbi:MAG: VWA domain-containing protein [Rhodobacter sp.]|nr:VWA domain-containing protein [Rhodobacter sp.]